VVYYTIGTSIILPVDLCGIKLGLSY